LLAHLGLGGGELGRRHHRRRSLAEGALCRPRWHRTHRPDMLLEHRLFVVGAAHGHAIGRREIVIQRVVDQLELELYPRSAWANCWAIAIDRLLPAAIGDSNSVMPLLVASRPLS
jgi:hypothetical protein